MGLSIHKSLGSSSEPKQSTHTHAHTNRLSVLIWPTVKDKPIKYASLKVQLYLFRFSIWKVNDTCKNPTRPAWMINHCWIHWISQVSISCLRLSSEFQETVSHNLTEVCVNARVRWISLSMHNSATVLASQLNSSIWGIIGSTQTHSHYIQIKCYLSPAS